MWIQVRKQNFGLYFNKILVYLLTLSWSVGAIVQDNLVITTKKGKIRGVTLKSATNREVDAWYGIPYAQPPVGNLRFRHPRHIDAWEGIKETTRPPNSCIQVVDTLFPGFEGAEMWNVNTEPSEDCLYLSVHVPKPRPTGSAVLVWIYGGGFYSGTSTLEVYDPRVLVSEENIIFVAMQYRVASLGFLFFDTEDVPGNAGLYDQMMALQWVKNNIEEFGGDPDKITIFGESAGGCSVALHLLSPLSRNLFSQAIMQSASALVPWGVITKKESIIRGRRLAEMMSCPYDEKNTKAMIECLRQKDATEMVNQEWIGIISGIAEFPFVPIVDGSFLDESPGKSLTTKNYKKTNILIGANKEEGNYFIMYYLTDLFKNTESVYVDRTDFIRSVSELNHYVKKMGREAITFEYTDWLNPNDPIKNREAIDRMVGDYQFTCPTADFARIYASTGNNVYMYYFTERSSTSPWPTWSGVLHGDEIAFVFGEALNKSKNYDKSEIALSKRMMGYWANFAKTGNPSLSADGTWSTNYWPLHTPTKQEVLELNANYSRVLEGLRVKKCAFWKKYLPKLLSLTSNNGDHQCQTSSTSSPSCCKDGTCCNSGTSFASTFFSVFIVTTSVHLFYNFKFSVIYSNINNGKL
ncbi:LOW QUALITY PROTEIN: acetylcholinesterase [Lepeophtheirus salmonis]|uniref:LOW QUALITY PROTEIN: acetylcholinesterase n=1 Tax=Lepeophtheirus salmonis TaxID=72036 RepID=UPI001AE13D20|nr:LOW QUALITY PROTEIN: acetylcholinesterase-like [Lepeophtheirus salmonis]